MPASAHPGVLAAHFDTDAALRPVVRSGVGRGETRTRFWNASNAPACSCAVSPGTWLVQISHAISSILADQLTSFFRYRGHGAQTAPHAGTWKMVFSKTRRITPWRAKTTRWPLMRSTLWSSTLVAGALLMTVERWLRGFCRSKRSPAAPILRSNAPMRCIFAPPTCWLNVLDCLADLPIPDRSRPRPIPT